MNFSTEAPKLPFRLEKSDRPEWQTPIIQVAGIGKAVDRTVVLGQRARRTDSCWSIPAVPYRYLTALGGEIAGKTNKMLELQGQFYVASEALRKPTKIIAPLCLSYHPPTLLDKAEVMRRAVVSRSINC